MPDPPDHLAPEGRARWKHAWRREHLYPTILPRWAYLPPSVREELIRREETS